MVGSQKAIELSKSFANSLTNNRTSTIYSVPYYLLTGRRGLTTYYKDKSYVMLCKHPHIKNCELLYPEINGNFELTADVIRSFSNKKILLRLAKYSDEDKAFLARAFETRGIKDIKVKYVLEEVMDWKYPIYVLDTTITGNMCGSKYEKIRNKFSKAAPNFTLVPISSANGISAMHASLYYWMGDLELSNAGKDSEVIDFYKSLFKNIRLYPEMFDGFITFFEGKPAGFSIWDNGLPITANGLASVSRRSIKGMSEYQIIMACRILSSRGIRFYNIGGSETESLDRHKREYLPFRKHTVSSYDIEFENRIQNHNTLKII